MGSRFDFTIVAEDSLEGVGFIEMAMEEISRIEALISSWDPNSQTSAINNMAGKAPVQVAPELYALIKRAIGISKLTDGAFDISYASMDRLWVFDGTMTELPDPTEIEASVAKVGYENIVFDDSNSSIYLTQHGMKIGFGALGKGYAADRAKAMLIEAGAKGGIINASGDMNTWGKNIDVRDWRIAIINPLNKEKVFATVPLNQGAVATSGDYEKFVMIHGKRYAHIINPKTGYPTSGITSVSIFAPKAELADAMATAVFVMGAEVGLNVINQLPGVECVIVRDDGSIRTSNNIDVE